MLETAERLIISEIGDFAASLPGGPVTSHHAEELQQELIARVQRVFADVKQQGTTVEASPRTLQHYHTHIVKTLIDAGAITQHNQISILQNELNAYFREHQAGGK